jgi:CII-binding regulator of phage lambda lysogenization HflD
MKLYAFLLLVGITFSDISFGQSPICISDTILRTKKIQQNGTELNLDLLFEFKMDSINIYTNNKKVLLQGFQIIKKNCTESTVVLKRTVNYLLSFFDANLEKNASLTIHFVENVSSKIEIAYPYAPNNNTFYIVSD